MANKQNGRGLATPPSFSNKKQNIWKKFTVLTVNPLDDEVVLWDVKARNPYEAFEKADAGSHNLDHYFVFNEIGFENLVKAIQSLTSKI